MATLRGLFAFFVCGSAILVALPLAGQQVSRQPVFTPSPNVGWISYGPEFIPAPSGPQPVTFDPAHPFINNAIDTMQRGQARKTSRSNRPLRLQT